MDSRRFDDLAAILARTETRRRAVWLLGTVVGAVAVADREAPVAAKGRKCGGKHRRCPIGRRCKIDNDCMSGTCPDGRCGVCTPLQLCGSDDLGACQCDKAFPSNEPTCVSAMPLGLTVDDCAKCPVGMEVCVTINGTLFNCYKRCGSRR